MIRQVKDGDASSICSIYNEYVLHTRITFEESAVPADEMVGRIIDITRHYPWLVYEEHQRILGYAYAGRWKERSGYRRSVELAFYVDTGHRGRGLGTQLLGALLERLRASPVHTAISGIALPNPASVALCERFGFVRVAHFKQVGFKLNAWVDVGYWQLVL